MVPATGAAPGASAATRSRSLSAQSREKSAYVPGPPKRFAQAIGAAFSTTAVLVWFGAGAHVAALAALAVTAALAVAALLEAAIGLCLGCKVFGALMRIGVIPRSVCEACADLSLRDPARFGEPARS